MDIKEIAVELTKIINQNKNDYDTNTYTETGILKLYKRIVKDLEDEYGEF